MEAAKLTLCFWEWASVLNHVEDCQLEEKRLVFSYFFHFLPLPKKYATLTIRANLPHWLHSQKYLPNWLGLPSPNWPFRFAKLTSALSFLWPISERKSLNLPTFFSFPSIKRTVDESLSKKRCSLKNYEMPVGCSRTDAKKKPFDFIAVALAAPAFKMYSRSKRMGCRNETVLELFAVPLGQVVGAHSAWSCNGFETRFSVSRLEIPTCFCCTALCIFVANTFHVFVTKWKCKFQHITSGVVVVSDGAGQLKSHVLVQGYLSSRRVHAAEVPSVGLEPVVEVLWQEKRGKNGFF